MWRLLILFLIHIFCTMSCSSHEPIDQILDTKCREYVKADYLRKIGIRQSPCPCVANQIAAHWGKKYSQKEINEIIENENLLPSMIASLKQNEVYSKTTGCLMDTYGVSEETSSKVVDFIKIFL